MTHEKIFKRADGSRVRVTVSLIVSWGDAQWLVGVERCEKGCRKWQDARAPCKYYGEAAKREERRVILEWVSQEEIESVMRELVEQIKPVF